jgi:hypothetical protein
MACCFLRQNEVENSGETGMNKRIKKKIEKRQAAETELGQLDMMGALHKLEEDFVQLAQAVFSEGREKSWQAVAGVRDTIARSEESLEQLLARVPVMGTQLAQALHNAAHGSEKSQNG